jgi:hypothetical protein
MKRASGVRDEIRGFRMGLRVRLQTRSVPTKNLKPKLKVTHLREALG